MVSDFRIPGTVLASALLGAALALVWTGCGPAFTSSEPTSTPCESDADCGTPGPCALSVCLASGRCEPKADIGPAPSDGNPCTADACDGGVAVHSPLPDGQACTLGGGSGTCQAGACAVACTPETVAVCDDGEPCTVDSCDAETSLCLHEPLPNQPTPGVTDIPGDCRRRRCIDGKDTDTAAPGDAPKASGPCTQGVCENGAPKQENLALDTPCGEAGKCDGHGACVGCLSDGECGQSTTCASWKCVATKCQLHKADAGVTCDDGNACTSSDTCDSGACVGGPPVLCAGNVDQCMLQSSTCDPASGCPAPTNKPDGTACSLGQPPGPCVEHVCWAGTCAQKAKDCGACYEPNSCNASSGACKPEPAGTSCGIANICDGLGKCVSTTDI